MVYYGIATYENDGDSDYTIFNLSIGAPAIFGYELKGKNIV